MWVLSMMKIDLLNKITSWDTTPNCCLPLCQSRPTVDECIQFEHSFEYKYYLIFEFSVAKVILVVFKIQVSRIDWEDRHWESKFWRNPELWWHFLFVCTESKYIFQNYSLPTLRAVLFSGSIIIKIYSFTDEELKRDQN